MKSEFNDVHYMEEFLFCLFNALDIGQKAIGFHHSGEQCGLLITPFLTSPIHAASHMIMLIPAQS